MHSLGRRSPAADSFSFDSFLAAEGFGRLLFQMGTSVLSENRSRNRKRIHSGFFTLTILVLCFTALLAIPAGAANYQIRGGGTPVLINAIGGSITGGAFNQRPFSVTVNFGEVGPANQNGIVSAVIPIQLRSSDSYQLTAQVTSSNFNFADAEAIQPSDIGFGLQNIREAGNGGNLKTNPDPVTNSVITPGFDNDPRISVDTSALRASYPGTLAGFLSPVLIMRGPRISSSGGLGGNNCSNCGILVDAILAIKPQYFTPGSLSVTITFTID